jgi:hypothetical protein
LTAGGQFAAFSAFVVAALSLVVLFFLLATLVATAQERTLAVLRDQTIQVKRWGGWVLLGIGSWLLALAIWAEAFAGIFPV